MRLRIFLTSCLVATGISVAFPTGALSAIWCGPKPVLLDMLAANELAPVGGGIRNSDGALIELLTSRDARKWVLIISTPEKSCLIEVGEAWRHYDDVEWPVVGDPA